VKTAFFEIIPEICAKAGFGDCCYFAASINKITK